MNDRNNLPAALLAPSILSADFANLAAELRAIEAAGADVVHVDVMDGHFVPNLTFGPPVIKCLRAVTTLPLDTHLMITNAESSLEQYAAAGCDWLTVQVEACTHLHRTVQQIRDLGMRPGVSLNPHTPLEVLKYVLPHLHHVLIMSVNPGFGGQQFIESTLDKVEDLRRWIQRESLSVRIEVDGGIKPDNIARVRDAGADIFVAGSAVFGSEDYTGTISALRAAVS